ncbi:hypothetical protein JYT20_00260 [Rhodothermus sp. AH-315-K08]|nr:hypothetical protein [Rhodothermus sp. AH-315-K08]
MSILIIGVLLGQGMQQPEPADIAAASPVSAEDAEMIAVEARAFSYLDRSKILLLGVVNFDPATEDPASLGSPHRSRLAQNLLQEASFLKTRLSRSDQQRLRALVGELEVILLQLANLEERVDIPDIEIVRDGVDRNAILFKIDLEEMRRSLDALAPTETSSARTI